MFAERTPITTSLISVSPWLFVSSPFPLPHQMNFVRQTRVYGLGFRNENRQAFCGVYVSVMSTLHPTQLATASSRLLHLQDT